MSAACVLVTHIFTDVQSLTWDSGAFSGNIEKMRARVLNSLRKLQQKERAVMGISQTHRADQLACLGHELSAKGYNEVCAIR